MSLHVGAKVNVYESVCVKHVRGSEFINFIVCAQDLHFSSVFSFLFLLFEAC